MREATQPLPNLESLSVDVVALDRASMDCCINLAVEQMIEIAVRIATRGILVARLDDGLFRVGLSDAVPFGYTEQRDLRS